MAGGRLHEIGGALEGAIFRRMKATDRLGQPFLYELEVVSTKKDISPYDVVGQAIWISVKTDENKLRHFHGIATHFLNDGPSGGYQVYQVELRPWLWLLTHTLDCRIFQSLTIPEILDKIFKTKHGFSDYQLKLRGTYEKRDYCVQYRESDFDFVSRLLEQEGIYYYFEHEKTKHTLVITDETSTHKKIDGDGTLLFRPPNEVAVGDEHIYYWHHRVAVHPSQLVLRDFDYEKPSADLEVRSKSSNKQALPKVEQYDYPGDYLTAAEGKHYLKIRSERLDAESSRMEGRARSFRLLTGALYKMAEHPRKEDNVEYLTVSTITSIVSGEIEQFSTASENRIDVEFVAIPKSRTFRPACLTRQPVIAGPQTAIVVGEKGKEIWTDSMGRVKVQFPWDREGKNDEKSSCWIRVAQIWSGKGWGSLHIPRIGQEVVVEFLEGNPDRPLITGRVYNGEQTVPYKLPDQATQSGLKSRSSPKGNAETFNELRFEDKKSEEVIYFHAQRDFERVVENNDKLDVGKSDSEDGSQTINIWKDRTTEIKNGNDKLTISAGDQTISMPAGTCEISAGKKIVLKVGGSSIIIEPAKIVIKSAQVVVQADMKADVNANIIDVKAAAVLKLSGGVVKLN